MSSSLRSLSCAILCLGSVEQPAQLTLLEKAEAHSIVLERLPDDVKAEWRNERRREVKGRAVVCGEVRWRRGSGSFTRFFRYVAFKNSSSLEGQRYFEDDWRSNCL